MPSDQQNNQTQYNDEIDLRDLIIALWEGKWIIIASVIFALAAAMAYLNLVPQTFKGQITLKSPTNTQMLALELGEAAAVMPISSQLLGEAVITVAQEKGQSISGKHPTWTINFTSQQPGQVVEELKEAMPSYLEAAQEALSLKYEAAVGSQVANQEKAIAGLQKQIALAKVAGIEINSSPLITAQTLTYLRGYKVLEAELDMLQQDYAKPAANNPFSKGNIILINQNLASVNLQPKIKPTLLLALSFILGGMLGVFVLIIRNVLRK